MLDAARWPVAAAAVLLAVLLAGARGWLQPGGLGSSGEAADEAGQLLAMPPRSAREPLPFLSPSAPWSALANTSSMTFWGTTVMQAQHPGEGGGSAAAGALRKLKRRLIRKAAYSKAGDSSWPASRDLFAQTETSTPGVDHAREWAEAALGAYLRGDERSLQRGGGWSVEITASWATIRGKGDWGAPHRDFVDGKSSDLSGVLFIRSDRNRCCRPLSIAIETPSTGRRGCSRMTVSPTAACHQTAFVLYAGVCAQLPDAVQHLVRRPPPSQVLWLRQFPAATRCAHEL